MKSFDVYLLSLSDKTLNWLYVNYYIRKIPFLRVFCFLYSVLAFVVYKLNEVSLVLQITLVIWAIIDQANNELSEALEILLR
jgi:hypothetical protein